MFFYLGPFASFQNIKSIYKEVLFSLIFRLPACKYTKNNTSSQEFSIFCNEVNGPKSQNSPQTMELLIGCVLLFQTFNIITKLKKRLWRSVIFRKTRGWRPASLLKIALIQFFDILLWGQRSRNGSTPNTKDGITRKLSPTHVLHMKALKSWIKHEPSLIFTSCLSHIT